MKGFSFSILDRGYLNTTAVFTTGASAKMEICIMEINADTAINCGAASSCDVMCNRLTGTVTPAGTVRLFVANAKSGVNQAAAGAVAGEYWVDTAAANVVKLGV